MGTLKKTAAIICSVAALAFAGVSAYSVYAYETVKLEDRAEELTADKIMYVADEVYAQAGETVDYSVYVQKNAGYTTGGITMYYDSRLKVVMADEIKAYCVKGFGAEGLSMTHSLNEKASIFGFSTMGTQNCTYDGKVYTIRFTVPDDAVPGSTYPIRLETVEMLNAKSELIDCTTVAGWIKVPDVTTTTTSVTVTSTTTATDRITTTTTDITTVSSTTTTAEPIPGSSTTTTAAPNPGSSTTTTSAPIPGSGSTTTTSQTERHTEKITDDTKHNPGDQEQTTANRTTAKPANGNSSGTSAGSKTDATKTGDSGVAVAAAALMVAGASAFVFRRKK